MFSLFENFSYQLSFGDKRIIDLINKSPDEYINISITQFAQKTNTVESTISKFVRHLGFENYRVFQQHLIRELEISKENRFYNPKNDYEKDIIIQKNYEFYAINETTKLLKKCSIDPLVQTIIESKIIFCIGSGNSFVAAQDFSEHLNRIGLISFATSDIFGSLDRLGALKSQDMIIFFSERFENNEYFKLAKYCDERNVKIVVITSRTNLTLTEDILKFVVNFYSHPQSHRPTQINNCKIQQIFVNNYLINELTKKIGRFQSVDSKDIFK